MLFRKTQRSLQDRRTRVWPPRYKWWRRCLCIFWWKAFAGLVFKWMHFGELRYKLTLRIDSPILASTNKNNFYKWVFGTRRFDAFRLVNLNFYKISTGTIRNLCRPPSRRLLNLSLSFHTHVIWKKIVFFKIGGAFGITFYLHFG